MIGTPLNRFISSCEHLLIAVAPLSSSGICCFGGDVATTDVLLAKYFRSTDWHWLLTSRAIGIEDAHIHGLGEVGVTGGRFTGTWVSESSLSVRSIFS